MNTDTYPGRHAIVRASWRPLCWYLPQRHTPHHTPHRHTA